LTPHDPVALKAKFAGRRVVASVSGGKDSGAMSLYLTELGIEHDRVFADTGWEHPDTYTYLRGPLTAKLGPIHEVRSELTMEARIRKWAMFPSRRTRWCTKELKVLPIKSYLDLLMGGGIDPVSAIGIRAEESAARAELPEFEWSEAHDVEVWRPLLEWTMDDVVAIHQRHGLAPNPLYLRGAKRVGCWPCINSQKSEINLIARTDPAVIDKIRGLETFVTEACKAKVEARGETLGSGRALRDPAAESIGFFGAGKPIDQVVAWSRTAKGGKNLALFAPDPPDEGCMRWGLCESGPKE